MTPSLEELAHLRWELCWQTPWEDVGSHEQEMEREAMRAVVRALEPAIVAAYSKGWNDKQSKKSFAPAGYHARLVAQITGEKKDQANG